MFRLLLLFVFLFPTYSYASGWVQEFRKHGLTQTSFSYYYADSYFDNSGKKLPLNGNYKKYEVNQYVEYGLTN